MAEMDYYNQMMSIAKKVTTFIAVSLAVKAVIRRQRRSKHLLHGRSRSGRTPNKNIGRKQAVHRLEQSLLLNNMQYIEVTKDNERNFSENDSERRFNIPCIIYELINAAVVANADYFKMEETAQGLNVQRLIKRSSPLSRN